MLKHKKYSRKSGFTIVELLIVIVVIAILATISIVAYNGIQTRAKNTKTINATSAWIKALKLYHAQNDAYPTISSCLGSTTTYSSGGSCWPGWDASAPHASFLSAMQPYIGSHPEPDTTNIDGGTIRRGALYEHTSRVIYMMQYGVSTCPNMSIPRTASIAAANGIYCVYQL